MAYPAPTTPEVVSVRMPRRGGPAERLAIVLARYAPLESVRVQFCDNGQRAHVVPQSISWSTSPKGVTC